MSNLMYMVHDPDELVDYPFDWGKRHLNENETITDHDVTISPSGDPDDVTLDRSEVQGKIVIPWVTGGKPGKRYKILCEITTSEGRVIQRSRNINVKEK